MPIQTGDNKFGVAKWIVDPVAGLGTHTTIASAITSASAGDTIFIRPGTYTENLTLKVGVDLAAFEADCQTPNVTIIGNCTLTTAGTVSISGIRLQTNGAACITVSGSAASILKLSNSFINAADATAIVFSSSSASALLYFHECTANIATTGIAYFTGTSAGTVRIIGGYWLNTGLSSTASTFSAGSFFPFMVAFDCGFTISGTAVISGQFCSFNAGVANATAITISAGSSSLNNSTFNGGTASAISVGTGATLTLDTADVSSSNANAITGLGTLRFGLITYTGSSSTNNVSTQTPFVTQPVIASSVGSWILIQTLTASSSANLSFTTGISYNAYAVVIQRLVPATNGVNFDMVVSNDGGSSYLSAGYLSTSTRYALSTVASRASTSTFALEGQAGNIGNSATYGVDGVLFLQNFLSGSASPGISGNLSYVNGTPANQTSLAYGYGPAGTVVNAIRFLFSSGNIASGTISIYGINQ